MYIKRISDGYYLKSIYPISFTESKESAERFPAIGTANYCVQVLINEGNDGLIVVNN